jgi:heme/copper-type cytochrome/quinol oxidase subunit 4
MKLIAAVFGIAILLIVVWAALWFLSARNKD